MAIDQGPVVQSALLRGELVRLRKESGLTQEQLAAELEWSASKLIRVEGGRSSITKVDLDALLDRYGVTSESRRDQLHALNRGARERPWWDTYRADITPAYLDFIGFETGAAFIRQFQNSFVPGLLQTSEYAQAVTVNMVDPVLVGSLVGLRLRRQSELAKRSTPPRQYYVIDEAVIRRHIGNSTDPAIMPNQLRSMADKAEHDDLITVRVVPFKAGAHRGMSGPFTLFEFEGGLPDVVYTDAGRAGFMRMSGSDQQLAEYRDDFEALLEDALPADKSIELIRSAADELS